MLSALFFLLESHAVPSQPAPLVPPALPALLSLPGGQFTVPALTRHHSQLQEEKNEQKKTVPGPGLQKTLMLGVQEDTVLFVWHSPHYKAQAG